LEFAYNEIKMRSYQRKARLGARLAEAAKKANHEKRRQGKTLKVVALSHGNGKHVPSIRVAGKWLRRFGFEIGDEVILIAAQNQILITGKEGCHDRKYENPRRKVDTKSKYAAH
jgi:hypothetical protein